MYFLVPEPGPAPSITARKQRTLLHPDNHHEGRCVWSRSLCWMSQWIVETYSEVLPNWVSKPVNHCSASRTPTHILLPVLTHWREIASPPLFFCSVLFVYPFPRTPDTGILSGHLLSVPYEVLQNLEEETDLAVASSALALSVFYSMLQGCFVGKQIYLLYFKIFETEVAFSKLRAAGLNRFNVNHCIQSTRKWSWNWGKCILMYVLIKVF